MITTEGWQHEMAMSGEEWGKMTYDASIRTPYFQLNEQNSHWSGGVKTEQLKLDEKHLSARWFDKLGF